MRRARAQLPYFSGPRPLVFAHRGGAALFPENTLLAFQGARKLGCRYIETDVHLSRDGVVVVMHDPRLERTTNGRGLLRDHTFDELRKLDAGYRFSPNGRDVPWRGQGVRIPSFEEVVTSLPDMFFNVELKQADPPMVRPFRELVARLDLYDRVLVAAENDCIARAFRRLDRGRMATSAARNEVLRFWVAARTGSVRLLRIPYHALQVPPRFGVLTVIDKRFIATAHEQGLQVHAWTIDEPGEMRRLLELGVDGLMSDRPDLLLGASKSYAANT